MLSAGQDAVAARSSGAGESELFAHAFEETDEGIVIADTSACVIDVNPAFTEITGYSRRELLGRNPRLLKSGHHDLDFYRAMWDTLIRERRWQGELRNRKKNGEVFVTRATIKAVENGLGSRYYIGFFSDITEPRRQQERIEALAYYDPLTGLPNRVLFADRMRRAVLAAQRVNGLVAVCCMDLNDFKPINDRFGHMAGDEVLAATGLRLQASMRADDTVARIGGDEFALLLRGIRSAPEVEMLVARVLHAIGQPCVLNSGHTVSVSGSLGVALYPDAGSDVETLLRRADEAMYIAKRRETQTHFHNAAAGGSRVVTPFRRPGG